MAGGIRIGLFRDDHGPRQDAAAQLWRDVVVRGRRQKRDFAKVRLRLLRSESRESLMWEGCRTVIGGRDSRMVRKDEM